MKTSLVQETLRPALTRWSVLAPVRRFQFDVPDRVTNRLTASVTKFLVLGLLVFGAVFPALANDEAKSKNADAASDAKPLSYTQDIEPIFRNNCQGCHQPAKAQGDYSMTSFDDLMKDGESGDRAIVPGDAAASYLLQQIEIVDGESSMPKKGKPLHESEIELVRRWIDQGALDDSVDVGPRYSMDSPPRYTRAPLITAMVYSPDGKWLASTGYQEVFLIDAESLQTRKRLVGLSERIESISFSPDSTRLAVTGGSPGKMGEVQVWDIESAELLLSKQITFDTLFGGRFSPDGSLIAFGGADNVVRAIDSTSGEQVLHQGAHNDWVRACVFNPSGTHLLSAGRDMTVKLTEVATERFVDNVTSITPGALRGGINALAMHPERDEMLVGGADGIPKVYRIFRQTERRIGDDANLIRTFPKTNGRIFAVDVSADGKSLAVASTLDGKSRVEVYPYDFDGELTDEIKAILKKRVAERKAEEKKRIEDLRNAISPATASFELPGTSVYALAFQRDGSRIAVGGSDGAIRILDLNANSVANAFSPVEVTAEDSSERQATLLAATNGLEINAADLPSLTAESELIPDALAVRLEVYPTEISLDSLSDYAQVVVMAEFASGAKTDVTRHVDFVAEGGVEVDRFGLVRANSDGLIQVGFRGQQAKVRLEFTHRSSHDHKDPGTVDFTRDVNPILSRLGCNAGTCHGAQKGKNGFKLSLRGYDPFEDLRALGDDLSSRRLNPSAPASSLMLLKPIGAVPHEGGVLLTRDSVHYETLRDWIAEGATFDSESQKVEKIEVFPTAPVVEREGQWQQFRVVATYPDGEQRDVTHDAFIESGNSEVCKGQPGGRVEALRRGEAPLLVRYEGAYAAATVTVMGDRSGFGWDEPKIYSRVDELVSEKWARMKIAPSELAEDHEFLRRVRLDLTGLPPTIDEFRAFNEDRRPSILKRMAKVDELIGSVDYVDHWANKWADLLQVNSKFIGKEGAKSFRDWIRKSVESNQAYDEFARDILTATGSNASNPAASYYKILRDPDLIMENTTHLFLAVRFNCNKCHDHPFEKWTQDQYYEMAAYFSQTGLKKDPASGNKRIGGTAVEGAKPLYEIVYDKDEGEMAHVRTGKPVAPSFPFDCEHEVKADATRRERLAEWITSKNNPYFARSFVNRLWGYMTGTGLIEPLDDIRAGNPPSNPALLDYLTDEFINSDFDTQHILRLICKSRTYQLSVASNRWNADDSINYSHAKAKRLPAEVLYDAVHQVTGAVSNIPGVEPGTRAAALPDVAVSLPDGFLNNLGRPVRESACECERSQDLQLGPIMALVSGPTIGQAISDPKCALPKMANDDQPDERLVRDIFVRVLSREATEQEVQAVLQSAEQIAVDHQALGQELAKRESWWVEERAGREAKRLAKSEKTETQIAAREKAIAADRKRMEEERLAKLEAAKNDYTAYRESFLDVANQYLESNAENANWFPLLASEASSSNKDQLTPQADRSIVAAGEGGKGVYTLKFETPLRRITGFRLEALPLAGLQGMGPGLPSNGNFVVTEIEVYAREAGSKESKLVAIKRGLTDYDQGGFSANQVFDGNVTDQKGWAVSPRGGTEHWAVFEFKQPIEFSGNTQLEFRIHQNHNAEKHRLAHFRLSVTTDTEELPLGLTESFAALSRIQAEQRNVDDFAQLFAYLEQSDKKATELKSIVAQLKKPLAPDNELVGLQNQLKLLQVETPDDPKLVQLRADFAASEEQVGNRRLTLAQDLTWALINSPAFLFNH
ncbi:MAG: DUF1549 domain-containing protein [Pirellulaceae bacterium]